MHYILKYLKSFKNENKTMKTYNKYNTTIINIIYTKIPVDCLL